MGERPHWVRIYRWAIADAMDALMYDLRCPFPMRDFGDDEGLRLYTRSVRRFITRYEPDFLPRHPTAGRMRTVLELYGVKCRGVMSEAQCRQKLRDLGWDIRDGAVPTSTSTDDR